MADRSDELSPESEGLIHTEPGEHVAPSGSRSKPSSEVCSTERQDPPRCIPSTESRSGTSVEENDVTENRFDNSSSTQLASAHEYEPLRFAAAACLKEFPDASIDDITAAIQRLRELLDDNRNDIDSYLIEQNISLLREWRQMSIGQQMNDDDDPIDQPSADSETSSGDGCESSSEGTRDAHDASSENSDDSDDSGGHSGTNDSPDSGVATDDAAAASKPPTGDGQNPNAAAALPSSAPPAPPPPRPALPVLNFQFRNGTVGEKYDELIVATETGATSSANSPRRIDLQVRGFEACGLVAEPAENGDERGFKVFGTPTSAGEFRIEFSHTWIDSREKSITQTTVETMIVNPDPRSLWKDLPPDPDGEYFKPNSDKLHLRSSSHVIAASMRGRSHAHSGTFRDDHIAARYVESTGWYLFAVADGAGSSPYSRRGSQIACDVTLSELEKALSSPDRAVDMDGAITIYQHDRSPENTRELNDSLYRLLVAAAYESCKDIHQEAEEAGREAREYATTLMLCIAKQYEGSWFVGAFGVGDGAIGLYREDDDPTLFNTPDGGEFAGQTRFVTMKEIWKSSEDLMSRIRFELTPKMTALIAMSDGVSDPKFQTDRNQEDPEYWHALWKELQQDAKLSKDNPNAAEDLLEWLNFWSRGNHDDRSIAVLLP